MEEVWSVKWLPVGQGGMYIFSRNNVPTYEIAHRQCDTEERLNYWIEHMREKNWWSKLLELEFYRLFLEGRKLSHVVRIEIPMW